MWEDIFFLILSLFDVLLVWFIYLALLIFADRSKSTDMQPLDLWHARPSLRWITVASVRECLRTGSSHLTFTNLGYDGNLAFENTALLTNPTEHEQHVYTLNVSVQLGTHFWMHILYILWIHIWCSQQNMFHFEHITEHIYECIYDVHNSMQGVYF